MVPLGAVSHRFNFNFNFLKCTEKIPGGTWEDNIRMKLKEIGISIRNWADSAQDTDYWRALVNAALDLWVT